VLKDVLRFSPASRFCLRKVFFIIWFWIATRREISAFNDFQINLPLILALA
jgi:hypothetical protein